MGNRELRHKLDTGIAALVDGNNEIALSIFEEIVEAEPSYMEAWNKLATVQYMLGKPEESIKSAKESLRLSNDTNFQALAGLGLAAMEESAHYDHAIDQFKK